MVLIILIFSKCNLYVLYVLGPNYHFDYFTIELFPKLSISTVTKTTHGYIVVFIDFMFKNKLKIKNKVKSLYNSSLN